MTFYWDISPLILSTLVTSSLGVFAFLRPGERARRTFGWMMFAVSIWTLCYVVSFCSETIEEKLFWTRLKYFGSTTGPAIWLILALQLCRQEKYLTPLVKLLIPIWALSVIAIVWSNDFHHLFWESFEIQPGRLEAVTVHGPLFHYYTVPLYFTMSLSFLIYLDFYRRTPTQYHRRGLVLICAGAMPLVADILQQLGFKLLPQVDQVPLSLLVSAVLFSYAIFRLKALDILPIARDLVVQNINAGIVVIDVNRRVVEINQFAMALTAHQNPVNAKIGEIFPGFGKGIKIQDGLEQEIEIDMAGETRCLLLNISAVSDVDTGLEDEKDVIGYVLVGLDITARKHAERELERRATTDPLTGLNNRRAFFDLAELEISRAKRQGDKLAVLMIDIDHFKMINDNHGHQAGDEVLKELATRCLGCLREIDLFARYGGEEFICLIAGNEEGVAQTAERLRAAFDGKPVLTSISSIAITLSLGVALFEATDENFLFAIQRADKALYHSKASGRNQLTLG